MSYLEKTMKKYGSNSYVGLDDLPDESPVPSASMTMTLTQTSQSRRQSCSQPADESTEDDINNERCSPTLLNSAKIITPKPFKLGDSNLRMEQNSKTCKQATLGQTTKTNASTAKQSSRK